MVDKNKYVALQKRLAIACCISAFVAGSARAELKALQDEELSDITGQAYIAIDQMAHPTQSNIEYTRINLGMKVETMLKADQMVLGEYPRWANHPTDPSLNGTPCYTCTGTEEGLEKHGADIDVKDFSLGYIYSDDYARKYDSVPMVAKGFDSRGRVINYQDGEIVPFEINDPFIEFAFDNDTNKMTGVRIGFGDAKGILSGDIRSITGQVDVHINDDVDGLSAARPHQKGNLIEKALTVLTPWLVKNGNLDTHAVLVDGTVLNPDRDKDEQELKNGTPDAIRADHIGMADGTEFKIEGADTVAANAVKLLSDWNMIGSGSRYESTGSRGCGLFGLFTCYNIYIQSEDCVMLGIPTCFPLQNFQSMPVGKIEEINGKQYITDTASGLFISFQNEDVEWSTGSRQDPLASFVNATAGAFINIPTGAVKVNLHEVYQGIPGVRREYIDRGVGLF